MGAEYAPGQRLIRIREKEGGGSAEAVIAVGLCRAESVTGFVIRTAALAGQPGIAADPDVAGGAPGLVGEGGGAVMAGTAVVAFVHGGMIEVLIFLGGPGLHEEEIVVAGLTIHAHVLGVVVVGEGDRFQGFGPDNQVLRRQVT